MKTNIRSTFCRIAGKALLQMTLLSAGWASAAPVVAEGERLVQEVPKDFKIVSRESNKTWGMAYMVPVDETAAHWTERVSTQVFYDAKTVSYFGLSGEQLRLWQDSCDASTIDYAKDGQQNGYTTHAWVQSCRFRNASNKPTIALIKMTEGRERVYLTQVVFHYAPDDAKVAQWSKYLDAIEVCDMRLKGRECPQPTAP